MHYRTFRALVKILRTDKHVASFGGMPFFFISASFLKKKLD